jgi:hypothetical protein
VAEAVRADLADDLPEPDFDSIDALFVSSQHSQVPTAIQLSEDNLYKKKKKKKKKKSLCNLSFFFFKTCESDCAKITTLYSTRTFDTRFTCSFARRRASPRRADRCVHGLLRAFADLFVVFGTIVNTRRLVECALDACRRRTDGHRHCASGGAVCQFCRSATDCGRGDTFVALYQQQYKWWHRCVGRYRFAHHAATAFGRH